MTKVRIHAWGQANSWWILTVVSTVIAVLLFAFRAEVRSTARAEAALLIEDKVTVVNVKQEAYKTELDKRLDRIENKLDRLIEQK